MKKLILLSAVVLAFTSMSSMIAVNPPEFKFEEETHDFGKIPQNKPVTYDFKFTNVGDEPLIISSAQPACGCTLSKFTSTPVKKGETGTITLTYNAAVAGSFSKVTQVTSNAKTPLKSIYIKGEVIAASAASAANDK
jgi:hypothetical protein